MTVIQVADSKNLRRSLILTSQMAEMGVPMVLALNMADEAKSAGIRIRAKRLAERLGVPITETVAVEKRGMNKLIASLASARSSSFRVTHHPHVQAAIARIAEHLPPAPVSRESIATMILAGDRSLEGWLAENCAEDQIRTIDSIIRETQARFRDPLAYLIGKKRLDEIDSLLSEIVTAEQTQRSSWMKPDSAITSRPIRTP